MSRLWLLAMSTLAACSGENTLKDSVPGTTDVGTTDPGTTGGTEPAPTGTISGTILRTDGQPMEGATVNLCREVCRLGRTDARGAFTVESGDGVWAFEVVVDPADPASGWSVPLVPVEMAIDVDQVLDAPIPVPMLDAIVPLTSPGSFSLTDGFVLTADPDDWVAPVLTPSAEPWLGAAAYDFPASGLPLHGLEGTVLAAWTVSPPGMHPARPWPVTLGNPGLAPGETAEVWVSDYATQAWLSAGTATVSEDGEALVGAVLPTLGMVLIVGS